MTSASPIIEDNRSPEIRFLFKPQVLESVAVPVGRHHPVPEGLDIIDRNSIEVTLKLNRQDKGVLSEDQL